MPVSLKWGLIVATLTFGGNAYSQVPVNVHSQLVLNAVNFVRLVPVKVPTLPLPYFNAWPLVSLPGSDELSHRGWKARESFFVKLIINKNGATTVIPNHYFGDMVVLSAASAPPIAGKDLGRVWEGVGFLPAASKTVATKTKIGTYMSGTTYYEYQLNFNLEVSDEDGFVVLRKGLIPGGINTINL